MHSIQHFLLLPVLMGVLALGTEACRAAPEPLILVASEPADGATVRGLRPAVLLQFDRPLNPSTVVDGAVTVTAEDADVPVRLSLLPGGDRLRLEPMQDLLPSSVVRIVVTDRLRGTRGEQAGNAFSLQLRVLSEVRVPSHEMSGSGRTIRGARLTGIPRAARTKAASPKATAPAQPPGPSPAATPAPTR